MKQLVLYCVVLLNFHSCFVRCGCVCVWECICNLNNIACRIEFSFHLSRANTFTRFSLSTVFFLLVFILFYLSFALSLSLSYSHPFSLSLVLFHLHTSRLKRRWTLFSPFMHLFVCLLRFVYRVCVFREWQIKCVFFIVQLWSVCACACMYLTTAAYLLTHFSIFSLVAFHPMLLFCCGDCRVYSIWLCLINLISFTRIQIES